MALEGGFPVGKGSERPFSTIETENGTRRKAALTVEVPETGAEECASVTKELDPRRFDLLRGAIEARMTRSRIFAVAVFA